MSSSSSQQASQLFRWLAPLAVTAITVGAFLPTLQNGFVDWDDRETLLENPHYRGLGRTQLVWMFTAFLKGHYQPLSWLSFSLDYFLWGMDPFGYHLTNLLLHSADAVLFYFVAMRLLALSLPGALMPANLLLRIAASFAALIFAIHPLRVESVAWATERRDVLSSLFLFSTVLCYLRYTNLRKLGFGHRMWMAGALVFYIFSLLSKASGISLPFVLLVLDVYPLRRLEGRPGKWFAGSARKVWWEKVPFFFLAVSFGIIALIAQREAGALMPLERHSFSQRVAQALYGIVFYIRKTLFPFGLSPLYEVKDVSLLDWPFLLSGVATLAVTICLLYFRRRWPGGLASWIYYGLVLAPVLGVAQSGAQLVADRYSYLSCLGWAVLAGGGLFYYWQALGSRTRRWLVVPAAVLVAGLGVLTWKQARVWHDTETLWRYAIGVIPESGFAHYNLATALVGKGELDQAIEHYHRVLRIDPTYSPAHYALGNALASRRSWNEAVDHYRRALERDPGYAEAHNNLGIALARLGKLEEAIFHFRAALRIQPGDAKVHVNLANVLAVRGVLKEAVDHYRKALEVDPEFAGAHEELARLLAQQGKREEAIEHMQEALRIMKAGPAKP
jgi:tetratricopeptide (TPR) repeat protein